MIRREAFERVGGYDEALPAAQDYDLWLRLAEVGRLANLPDVVLQYRLHLLSVTSTRRAEQTQCLVEVCRRARQKRGLASLPRRSQRRYPNLPAFRQRLQWVRLALRAGHFETARKHAVTARREAPWRLGVHLHLLAVRIAWFCSDRTRSGTVGSRARGAPPAIPPHSVGG
jgi:GT2 family glycosyltransferase